MKLSKVACHYCSERFHPDALLDAKFTGGGTYRRPPRNYPCRLCSRCVEELLRETQKGHYSVFRYSILSLEDAARRAGLKTQRRRL